MKRIVKTIYNYVLEKKKIPEDFLYEFSQNIIKIVQSGNVQELPPEFEELQNYVEMYWRGRKYEREENPIRIYQLGQLLSYVNLIRDVIDSNKDKVSMTEYAVRWDNRFLVFQGMYDKPGITHKQLARISKMSPSALSQFMDKTKWDGYYTYRIVGREKYYYLTPKGNELYALFCKERKEEFSYNYLYMSADDLNNEIAGPISDSLLEQTSVKLEVVEASARKRSVSMNKEVFPIGAGAFKKEEPYARAANTIGEYNEEDRGYFKKGIWRKTRHSM